MNEKPARVGIYARISEDKDGQQTATVRQIEDCRTYAERHGWEVVDEFEDIDLSAFNTKAKRPEFERMVGALRAGDVDGRTRAARRDSRSLRHARLYARRLQLSARRNPA